MSQNPDVKIKTVLIGALLTCVPYLQEDDPLTGSQRWWGWRGGDKPPTRQHLTSAATDNQPSTPLNADCVLPPSLMTLPLTNVARGHVDCAPLKDHVDCAPLKDHVDCAPLKDHVDWAPLKDHVDCAPLKDHVDCAPLKDHVDWAPLKDHVDCAPLKDHVDCAPLKDHVDCAPLKDHVDCAPLKDHVDCAPLKDHVDCAPLKDHVDCAPLKDHVDCAPLKDHVDCTPLKDHVDCAPLKDHVDCAPLKDHVDWAPLKDHVDCAPLKDHVDCAPLKDHVDCTTLRAVKHCKIAQYLLCTLCDIMVPNYTLHQHNLICHLPWFFDPSTTCWVCEKPFGYHIGWSQHMSGHTAEDRRKGQFAPHFTRWSHMMIGLLNWATTLLQTETYAGLIALFTQRGWCKYRFKKRRLLIVNLLAEVATMMDMPILAKDIRLDPPNHPVSLLMSKCFFSVFAYIRPEQRDSYKRYIDPSALPSGEHTVHAVGMDTHCRLLLLKAREDKGKDPVPTWDALFSQWRETVQEDSITVDLAAVVDNRVDPSEWQRPVLEHVTVNNKTVIVKTTYGAPPKLAETVDGKAWEILEARIRSVDCCAIGECGLDYNAPALTLPYQRLVFQQQIALAKELEKPLILHLRGNDSSESTSDVMNEALLVLKANTVKYQKIYIHGFIGSVRDFNVWRKAFPNSIFGISQESLEAKWFSDVCCRLGLLQLTLETNSPQLSPQGVDGGHPYDIVRLAQRVAERHNVPSWVVLRIATHNTKKFYRVQSSVVPGLKQCSVMEYSSTV